MKSQIFAIDDLLLGQTREVRIYTGEFVLSPEYAGGENSFRNRILYLGVADEFDEIQTRSFVKLEPFYRIIMPNGGELSSAKIKRLKYANSLYANFFKTIFTGRADVISRALRKPPFRDMEQLADAVKRLKFSYDESLADFLENRVKELSMT
ncbi:hypothetical protein J4429_04925 [Candidatus Pacearchaeota archaeon]|nr:hypothetical protein [Candidatus Pacearchaeota archaeon]